MSIFGNKGKFSERLKKFRINKNKQKQNQLLEQDKNSKNYNNFLKVMYSIPLLVYSGLNTSTKEKEKQIKTNKNKTKSNLEEETKLKFTLQEKQKRRDLISNIDVSLIEINKNNKLKDNLTNTIIEHKETKNGKSKIKETKQFNRTLNVKNSKNEDLHGQLNNNYKSIEDNLSENFKSPAEVQNMEKKIINRIKKILIKMVNEYEILESELFLISIATGDEKKYEECKQTIDEIKKMLCKIDKLKAKYDFLKDNFDFEYMVELDDNFLAEDILELKNNVSNDSVKTIASDYKLLDLYKFLYLRIDKLEDQTIEYEDYKNSKMEELKKRDISFDKLNKKVYAIDDVNNAYSRFVNDEQKYLDEISKKVSKVDSHEEIDVRLVGFNKLLTKSFKYLGLLMISPLKGVIPTIVTETIITSNVIKNLSKNLHWETKKKMVYEAIDFSSEIDMAISDLDSTDNMVDKTLEELALMKDSFNKNFKQYQNEFVKYDEVINKINDMENKILGNKIKIEIIKKRSLEQKLKNSKKLVMVKKLNRP